MVFFGCQLPTRRFLHDYRLPKGLEHAIALVTCTESGFLQLSWKFTLVLNRHSFDFYTGSMAVVYAAQGYPRAGHRYFVRIFHVHCTCAPSKEAVQYCLINAPRGDWVSRGKRALSAPFAAEQRRDQCILQLHAHAIAGRRIQRIHTRTFTLPPKFVM